MVVCERDHVPFVMIRQLQRKISQVAGAYFGSGASTRSGPEYAAVHLSGRAVPRLGDGQCPSCSFDDHLPDPTLRMAKILATVESDTALCES